MQTLEVLPSEVDSSAPAVLQNHLACTYSPNEGLCVPAGEEGSLYGTLWGCTVMDLHPPKDTLNTCHPIKKARPFRGTDQSQDKRVTTPEVGKCV